MSECETHTSDESGVRDELAYLIVHERLGVWLGDSGGAQFWSNAGPHPFYAAPTFNSPEECHEQIYTWGPHMPLGGSGEAAEHAELDLASLRVARVRPDVSDGGRRYASLQACMSAGVRGWLHMMVEEPCDDGLVAPTMH